MYRALHHELSLDDFLDLEEIDDVARSWRDAAQANNEHRTAQGPKRRRGRRGAAR